MFQERKVWSGLRSLDYVKDVMVIKSTGARFDEFAVDCRNILLSLFLIKGSGTAEVCCRSSSYDSS